MKLLSDEFLGGYPDVPEHMNQLAQFVFYRTYPRWLPNKDRRETFKEAIARAVEYNVGITIDQYNHNNFPAPIEQITFEAEKLFDNIFNLRQFLSGRTHWVGGADTKVASKFPLSNFNCAFLEINNWEDLSELFYLLLVGTGVGFSCSKEMAHNLLPVRRDYTLLHSEYNPVSVDERLEHTKLVVMDNGYAKIYVGDSKEGWVEAFRTFMKLVTEEQYDNIAHIKISYNSIRPKGERLKTFGGTASGYEPLKDMFIGIDKVLKDQLDTSLAPMEGTGLFNVRPIHVLDIGNLIGNNVVVGGVRRTSEIFLCDVDDWEVILAKYGLREIEDWSEHTELGTKLYALGVLPEWWDNVQEVIKRTSLTHRYMSNNSIMFREQPSKELLNVVFSLMKDTGEPGFVNIEAAQKRRPNVKGVNPCGEVLLDSKQVCNLTTINMMAFIKDKSITSPDGEVAKLFLLDYPALMEAQVLSVRAGMRMTCIDLELPEWNEKHKRDRLIGASMTGWKDAMEALDYSIEQEAQLLNLLSEAAYQETIRYSYVLRIPQPLLATTIKPEGTLSQVANGVSSGLHVSHAPYYIRRVRINANDPLAVMAAKLGWDVKPENNDNNDTLETAKTLVVSFPVKSTAKKTRAEQTIEEQFDNYFMFQDNYTTHNSSNTITIKDGEWEIAENTIYDNWDNFIGVTFIPYDGGTYEQMPYEEISEETYNTMIEGFKPFDLELLRSIESEETEKDVENMTSCDSGICPIF